MALSADCRPHFTTIAAFVSELHREIVSLFVDVLFYASELGLLGRQHFAVDGCKLPSNASKRWSGTHQELRNKCQKLEDAAAAIVQKHRQRDAALFDQAQLTADGGFHSKVVLTAIEKTGVDAYIADLDFRRRDPAFADTTRHKQRSLKEHPLKRRREREARPKLPKKQFTLEDFVHDEQNETCFCPAGHKLYKSGMDMPFNGYRVAHFRAPITACTGCPLRSQCLRHPERTKQRQLTVIKERVGPAPETKATANAAVQRMRKKFDTPVGRATYSKRIGTVEPVFGNIQNKGMRRFTMRGQLKVNAQWLLFTIVRNIEKIARVLLRPR